VKATDPEAPHYAAVCSLLSFIASQAQIPCTSPTVQHLQPVFPSRGNPGFTPMHNKHNYTSVYFNQYVPGQRQCITSRDCTMAHTQTCRNPQARCVELKNAASSEGCCFCWQRINQNNSQSPLRPFKSDRVSMYFPHNLQNICKNTKQCIHVPPALLNQIPKRQMPLFFMHPLCSFRDMESEAKENAHPCHPPPHERICNISCYCTL
jgi:hypothetical protein